MQILVDNISKKVLYKGTIEKGNFPVDPSTELYKIKNEDGDFYAVTQGFSVYDVDAEEVHEEVINEEVINGKWCYTNVNGFYENPNWKPDEKNEMEKLKRQNEVNAAKIDYIAMMADINLPEEEFV